MDLYSGRYDYFFRDYDPMVRRWSTVAPIRDGLNWYAYANNNPLKFVDPTGLAPQNLPEDQHEKYIESITAFAKYNKSTNTMDLPSSYDCADVATWLYGNAMKDANGTENAYKSFQHNGENVSSPKQMQSGDYFGNNVKNISFYGDTVFNSKNVEVGTVGVWKASEDADWVGHIATVVDVKRDDAGNVTKIKIIQGHTGGGKTQVVPIPNQSDLDTYAGTFLGWGELGANSTTPNPSPDPPATGNNANANKKD